MLNRHSENSKIYKLDGCIAVTAIDNPDTECRFYRSGSKEISVDAKLVKEFDHFEGPFGRDSLRSEKKQAASQETTTTKGPRLRAHEFTESK